MVDTDIIKRILSSLNESLEHLKRKREIPLHEYQQNKDMQAIVERKLETSIQACIDIGNHIIAQNKFGNPTDYGQIFLILGEKNIISSGLSHELKKMAGFRNILIHDYRDILNEKVYQILKEKLDDIYAFAQHILDYLDKSEK